MPKKKAKSARQKGDSVGKTHALLKEGKGIAEICKERNLAQTTIVGHIEELFMQGKLDKRDVERIAPRKILEVLADIATAFDAHGGEKLAPIHAALHGKYSFDDLRLARILI